MTFYKITYHAIQCPLEMKELVPDVYMHQDESGLLARCGCRSERELQQLEGFFEGRPEQLCAGGTVWGSCLRDRHPDSVEVRRYFFEQLGVF